jgi:hypothetical protein
VILIFIFCPASFSIEISERKEEKQEIERKERDAVRQHFEESLRLAQQKVSQTDWTIYILIDES